MTPRMTTDQDALRRTLGLLDRIDGRVTVVGSVNADLTVATERLPRPGETIAGGPLGVLSGGKSANQAAAASRLGAKVGLVGAVGADGNGDLLLDRLGQSGVDLSGVVRVAEPTGTAVIIRDSAGENMIVISPGANARVDVGLVEAAAWRAPGAGALGLALEIGLPAVRRAARLWHRAGARVVLNYSPLPDRFPDGLFDDVDVLLVNEHELAVLVPGLDLAEGLHALGAAVGIDRCVVTLGGAGSVVWEQGRLTRIPALPVASVDSTGAGDAFTGAILAGLASGLDLTESARLASVYAGHSTTMVGAQASYVAAEGLRAALLRGGSEGS